MPITNKPDPDYEPEPFATFKDGKYDVNGIRWITNDDQGAPCFVPSKGLSPIVARYTSLIGEKDGPPGSVAPSEIALLVKSFGADPTKLPDRERDPTAYLITARDLINNVGAAVPVTVSGGWIQSVKGMDLPPDSYFVFEFGGISTKNDEGNPAPRPGTYGNWFGANLIVTGDVQQRATPYDGVSTFMIVSYGLVVNEHGLPEYETDENQKWTSNAYQFYRFARAFAPGLEEEDFGDVDNVLPELEELARKAKRSGRRVLGQVTRAKKSGRIGVNVGSLQALGETETVTVKGTTEEQLPERHIEDEVKEPPTLKDIFKTIDGLCGEAAFTGGGELTTAGKSWCKENLKAFLQEKRWPARFTDWNDEQRTAVLLHLMSMTSSDEPDF